MVTTQLRGCLRAEERGNEMKKMESEKKITQKMASRKRREKQKRRNKGEKRYLWAKLDAILDTRSPGTKTLPGDSWYFLGTIDRIKDVANMWYT